MTITVSAPATTANLGPGFDCFALELQPRCTVTATPSDSWTVRHDGAHPLAEGDDDMVLSAVQRVSDHPLTINVSNDVPIGKGLGSSAAALVAGVAAGLGVAEPPRDEVFTIAGDLEGHLDQVAAAVHGGLVLISADGVPLRLPLHPSLGVLVAVPEETLPTREARSVVAPVHPIDRVVRSLSRVSALAVGLATGEAALLAAASGDEIHEAPRAPLSPIVATLIEAGLDAGALHAARSGAGPSVVAFARREDLPRLRDVYGALGVKVVEGQSPARGLVVESV